MGLAAVMDAEPCGIFEVDARFITLATLSALVREGQLAPSVVHQAIRDLDINPDKIDPMTA